MIRIIAALLSIAGLIINIQSDIDWRLSAIIWNFTAMFLWLEIIINNIKQKNIINNK